MHLAAALILALAAWPVCAAEPALEEQRSSDVLRRARHSEAPPQPLGKAAAVRTGLGVLQDTGFAELAGLRVGLITNQTGRDDSGKSTAEVLALAPGVLLKSIFTPEHGLEGVGDGPIEGGGTVRLGGRDIPVISLYRKGGMSGMRPRQEDLKGLDALVFDIQDVGTRFYTYLGTMAMALEEAKKAGMAFYVLDRPNPVGGETLEGPILEDLGLELPTAYFAVPVRHGLTAGEMALWHNRTAGHPKLRIVKMQGWSRSSWYDETGLPWVALSPNMRDLGAAAFYPGIGCFEAANISVGRGTASPFRWIGAPWLHAEEIVARLQAANLPGLTVAVRDDTPTADVFKGQLCRGVQLTVTDRGQLRSLHVFVHLAVALRDFDGKRFRLNERETLSMVGVKAFWTRFMAGASASELISLVDEGPRKFEAQRRPFLLY